MPKISLIIPTLHVNNYLDKCVESFKGQYDELIIVDDVDASLAYKQNKGMRLATGDFLVICNDDVEADKGSLNNLCAVDKVYSPLVNGGVFKQFHAHIFCLPRKVYAEVGGFDETYPGAYYIDSDLWMRLTRAGYSPDINYDVDVRHEHAGNTIHSLPTEKQGNSSGREYFISKWGATALGLVGA